MRYFHVIELDSSIHFHLNFKGSGIHLKCSLSNCLPFLVSRMNVFIIIIDKEERLFRVPVIGIHCRMMIRSSDIKKIMYL